MLATMMHYPLTLAAFVRRAESLFGDVEVVCPGRDRVRTVTTYRQLAARVRRLASALRQAGVQPGDRVATLMWNHTPHVEAYFGVPCAGAVLHTLNLRLHPDDLAYIVNHAEDRFVIVDDVLWPLWEKVAPQVAVERVFVVRWTDAPLPAGTTDYEELVASGDDVPLAELDEEAPAGMCYTSGTTGRPKGVVYSHRAIVLHSLGIAMVDGLGLSCRDTVLPVVPQFHANAWGIPFAAVMVGAKQVLPGPYLDAVSLLNLFEQERVTIAAGVPTVWLAILGALDAEPTRWDLPDRMRMVVGGSAAPPSMVAGFDKHGLTVVHAWGMTELSPLGSVAHVTPAVAARGAEAALAARCKQGVPVPLVEVRAVSDSGEAPWDGVAQGELQVRGPWVASAYHRQEDAADRWTDDGWFRTGDVVTIDPDGYIRLTDRTKDLIKSGGEWISSVDLENALMGHPAIAEAAVIACAHPKWCERPVACVVFKPGQSVPDAELAAWLGARFASWWLPDRYEVVDQIPRTSTGKFLKSSLRERFKDVLLAR